jgi:hypothetical protein
MVHFNQPTQRLAVSREGDQGYVAGGGWKVKGEGSVGGSGHLRVQGAARQRPPHHLQYSAHSHNPQPLFGGHCRGWALPRACSYYTTSAQPPTGAFCKPTPSPLPALCTPVGTHSLVPLRCPFKVGTAKGVLVLYVRTATKWRILHGPNFPPLASTPPPHLPLPPSGLPLFSGWHRRGCSPLIQCPHRHQVAQPARPPLPPLNPTALHPLLPPNRPSPLFRLAPPKEFFYYTMSARPPSGASFTATPRPSRASPSRPPATSSPPTAPPSKPSAGGPQDPRVCLGFSVCLAIAWVSQPWRCRYRRGAPSRSSGPRRIRSDSRATTSPWASLLGRDETSTID